ncbi:ATP-binding protein [Mangrovihabitans endophyticus]|uniref:SARP family transcriptional regulator n=1 Tax=Mangrovihabitans endophyticus TaxID=1751298 RepID=A0A8J3FQ77_9ACTN|nr:AAA family ATPase [Mangrovihabitans endophyticus]GGK98706.1 SARP family transcriptional regulator [Mangrovihabitans endophyticus]
MPRARTVNLLGRRTELTVMAEGIAALQAGTGGVFAVEGEPGIGKSTLIDAVATTGEQSGCTVLRGAADQLAYPVPLRLLLDCLDVTQHESGPRPVRPAELPQARWPDPARSSETPAAAAEMILRLVDEACAAAPTMIVLDDIQWADDASLDVCRRLITNATHQPLLLVLAFRPVPRGPGMQRLRTIIHSRDVVPLTLGPLAAEAVRDLIADATGAPPGPVLSELATQAAGNPLYVLELVEALVREGQIRVGQQAEVRTPNGAVPKSLSAALASRLSFVPASATDMLRVAALLGEHFAVTEVSAVLARSAIDIACDVEDALAAGVLVDAGSRMRFRHPLIRRALYDDMPTALRSALHREVAQTLVRTGAGPQRVAQQLHAADLAGDHWTRHWLVETVPVLAVRAPHVAADLLRRELGHREADTRDQAQLSGALAHILVGTGEHEEAVTRARQALASSTEPADRAGLSWLLARALFSGGRNDEAVAALEQALSRPDQPDIWRARMLASLAMFERAGRGALDAADRTARQALTIGEASGDTFAIAYALTDLWLSHSVRRQHLSALACLDRALDTVGTASEHTDLRAYALNARIFTLQNLARWADAEETLRQARHVHLGPDRPDDVTSSITAAVLMFWRGHWDDALAELNSMDQSISAATYRGLRERGPVWLWHGVSALIAARRGRRAMAAEHLREGWLRPPTESAADRENTDFLLVAQAMVDEQNGDHRRALSHLAGLLDRRPGEMTLVHQWLPALVRVAHTVGDGSTAQAAVDACRAEADAEQVPARATAAADWSAGLHENDPVRLRAAADHYRTVGVPVELGGALEDLAVVLAERGDTSAARAAVNEAVEVYGEMEAAWDIRRAEARLRRYGVRRGVRGRRAKRATHGWEALTPTEHKVALLVASGRSTSDIALQLFLTRRTTQTHISRILAKLGMSSRVEIARAAFQRDPGAIPADL